MIVCNIGASAKSYLEQGDLQLVGLYEEKKND